MDEKEKDDAEKLVGIEATQRIPQEIVDKTIVSIIDDYYLEGINGEGKKILSSLIGKGILTYAKKEIRMRLAFPIYERNEKIETILIRPTTAAAAKQFDLDFYALATNGIPEDKMLPLLAATSGLELETVSQLPLYEYARIVGVIKLFFM